MPVSDIIHSNDYLGKFVNIVRSRNERNSNRSGTVVNETKNMLYLITRDSKNVIRIPKNEICEYEIYRLQGTCHLDGKRLLGRPERLINIVK
ncbi:MAG: ribonuclease P protein subunit [Candidatus Nitrosocosmicus sp.]|nr:ribonuclease P protein subunit [Candidatus Nitrosocosmicus sp.]MDN5865925.1 ribonuclease P protein subunit [Candidatus Nitrosocosmicus sp.]